MKSTYLKNAVVDWIANGANPAVLTPYISLHSANPGLTGTSELSGNNYARVDASACFPASSGGVATNDAAVTFPTASGDWTAATHFGVWDDPTAGNFLYSGKLGTWSADIMAWIVAAVAYKLGDGADPGAVPTFTPVPRTVLSGDTPRFAVGTLSIKEG
jgi:hypothetical protein